MTFPSKYPVRLEIPVAWGEQDAFGHLNNVVYFRYMENVRMHFLERIGILRSHAESGISVLLASTTCDFKKQVHWPQRLTIRTGCTRIGTTSFTMGYAVTDEEGSEVATGTSVQVMFDFGRATKVAVPDAVRKAIADLQVP